MSNYPSDISREKFELIRPILESCRKRTSPRRVDLYEVFCGVVYLLKSGCQWRMLPKEYPKWRTCHYYFSCWSEHRADGSGSVLEDVLKKIGRGSTFREWKSRQDQFYYHRCPEC